MDRLLNNLRLKPHHVKDQYALLGALLVTLIIGAVWATSLPARIKQTVEETAHSTSDISKTANALNSLTNGPAEIGAAEAAVTPGPGVTVPVSAGGSGLATPSPFPAPALPPNVTVERAESSGPDAPAADSGASAEYYVPPQKTAADVPQSGGLGSIFSSTKTSQNSQ